MSKLRKARLVTLSINAKKGNKIFRNTDENPFCEDQVDNFDELLKNGAIKLVEEKAEEKEEVKEVAKTTRTKSKK